MIGHGIGIPCNHSLHAEHVGQKRHQFEGLGAQTFGAGLPSGIAVEQMRVVSFDGAAAGTGRHDHVIEVLERDDDLPGQVTGVGAVTGIVGRLTAAGLGGRDLDRAAGVFQQFHGGEADRRAEYVHQTGHEQADTRLGGTG